MNKNIIFKIIEKLDWIISEKRQVGFCSVPDYTDNVYALFKYMVKNNYHKEYKIIWLISGKPMELQN